VLPLAAFASIAGIPDCVKTFPSYRIANKNARLYEEMGAPGPDFLGIHEFANL
jgi:hypothetical protein